MDKAIEAAAMALAPEMEGGREFDKMPIDRTQLREWARKAMCGFNDATQEDAKEAARAVLEAIREPTPKMIENGNIALSRNGVDSVIDDDSTHCWQAMLDTALKGE